MTQDVPMRAQSGRQSALPDFFCFPMVSESPSPADSRGPTGAPAGGSDATPAGASDASPYATTAARLAELFPALFGGQPKPLKLRIQVDIQERAPGVFSKQALSAFFRRYTSGTSYLIAVTKAAHRFDLDGQAAGELTEEHRKVAADELARRRSLAQARREQEQGERRQRALLLRDFETTKLTTANFCALKGIAAESLDGLLAQARAEALEDAQRPQRPHHDRRDGRPGPGPRKDGQPRQDARGPRGGNKRPPRQPA
jgi:hypothetical protein